MSIITRLKLLSSYTTWKKFNSKNFLRTILLRKGKILEIALEKVKEMKKY